MSDYSNYKVLILDDRFEHHKYEREILKSISTEEVSFYLHDKYGFFHVGVLKEVGFKFNRYIDFHLMQLILD